VAGVWGYSLLWALLVILSFGCAAGFRTLFQRRRIGLS
jgi:hypothetical protein